MANGENVTGLYVDRYELAMALAYWQAGRAEEPACFDYFFRSNPFGNGYTLFAGLESLLDALGEFAFSENDLAYLRGDGFPDGFLDYLRDFRFSGRIHAAREGEVVFPHEPVARVEGGLLETQVIETLTLNALNFQSLIATKAARCVRAAGDRAISEFGLRRGQGLGGFWASRAAVIGGCASTSNVAAGRLYGVPTAGTMAHSFVQSHDNELEAFRAFARIHGSATIVLLDTYDTLESGLPNAIRLAREMAERGETLRGVRVDSGDLAYMARVIRQRLDAEGLGEVKIVASNQLDEWVIRSLNEQGAPIDLFGIGTKLAVGLPDAALDGVYKLSMADGAPRMKFSETLAKTTFPGIKSVTRHRDAEGRFEADAIHLAEDGPPSAMRHPFEPRKRMSLDTFESEPLLRLGLDGGRRAEDRTSVADAAAYARSRRDALPLEYHRFENPHTYKVGISPELEELRAATRDRLEREATHSA